MNLNYLQVLFVLLVAGYSLAVSVAHAEPVPHSVPSFPHPSFRNPPRNHPIRPGFIKGRPHGFFRPVYVIAAKRPK